MAAKSSDSSEKTTTRRRRTRRVRVEPETLAENSGGEAMDVEARDSEVESRSVEDVPRATATEEPDRTERPKRGRRRTSRQEAVATPAEEPFGHGLADEAGSADEDSYYEAAERVENRYEVDEERVARVETADRTPRVIEPTRAAESNRPRQGERNEGSGEPSPTTGRRRRRRRRRGRQAGGEVQGGHRGDRGDRHQPQHRDRQKGRQVRVAAQNGAEVIGVVEGVLELHPKGYGFLRDPKKNYAAQDSDVFVSSSLIEKSGLREGVLIRGEIGPGTKGQGPRLKGIETIDGRTVEEYQKIKFFDDLTAINPFEQIRLEQGPRPITMRVMDLLTPIAKGQRALIVAPPRSGKTMLLQDIADSVSLNHPEIELMVLLIDERPEEVTEMCRRVRGEVIASSMDRDVESHVRISQLIIERAKRLAEAGKDVFVLLDSITRTARAFNKWIGSSGKTGTGGLDVRAMDIPRKMFGTARRFDEGGSLTVVATALIDTGSRMDDAIFQEFKGTGNMELVLSRDLADRRIWPAMDISLSGTRREEKILAPEVLESVTMMRRSLVTLSSVEAMEQLTRQLERFPTNAEFLAKIRSVL